MKMEFSPAGQAMGRYAGRGTPTGTGAPKPASSGRGGGGGGGGGSDIAAEAKRIYDETRTAAEKYRIEEQRLGELLRANAITQDTYSRAIDGLKDKYRDTSDSLSQFADTFRSGFSDMISGVIDGSMKAEDAVRRMVTRLASMMIENQIFSLLGNLMPNVFGAGGFLPLTKSAMGNVFMGGRVQAFATGGVVNGPTAFPMRGGMGLMGEAGPEAILPLTRVNGSLGVKAAGAGGGSRTMVQVINQGGGEVRQERQQGPNGDELIRITVGKQLARGDHDSAMRGRYSARPAGVKR
jgi:phage-related minor tail protein